MRAGRKPGTTLIELLVYASLLLLVLGAIYGTFHLSRRYYACVEAGTESQQEAMKGMLALSEELAQAAGESLSDGVSAAPQGVRFLSARTDDRLFEHDPVTGDLLWQRWVCIYLDAATGALMVVDQPLGAPTAEVPEVRPTVAELAGSPALARWPVARHIQSISFPAASPGNFGVRLGSRVDAAWFPSGRTGLVEEDRSTQVTLWSEIPIRH